MYLRQNKSKRVRQGRYECSNVLQESLEFIAVPQKRLSDAPSTLEYSHDRHQPVGDVATQLVSGQTVNYAQKPSLSRNTFGYIRVLVAIKCLNRRRRRVHLPSVLYYSQEREEAAKPSRTHRYLHLRFKGGRDKQRTCNKDGWMQECSFGEARRMDWPWYANVHMVLLPRDNTLRRRL